MCNMKVYFRGMHTLTREVIVKTFLLPLLMEVYFSVRESGQGATKPVYRRKKMAENMLSISIHLNILFFLHYIRENSECVKRPRGLFISTGFGIPRDETCTWNLLRFSSPWNDQIWCARVSYTTWKLWNSYGLPRFYSSKQFYGLTLYSLLSPLSGRHFDTTYNVCL